MFLGFLIRGSFLDRQSQPESAAWLNNIIKKTKGNPVNEHHGTNKSPIK